MNSFSGKSLRPLALAWVRLALVLALAGCLWPAFAQQTITTATLSGRVEDANGAGLSGARLTIRNLENNQQLTNESDAAGHYRFSYLDVVSYKLKV